MPFNNPIVAGETLVIPGVESDGYATGIDGWRIARDGTAEFNEVTVRGDVEIQDFLRIVGSDPDATIELGVTGGTPVIDITSNDGTRFRFISSTSDSLVVGPTSDPNSRLIFVDGEGIALRSSVTGGVSILFDDDDGFLKRGTYSPWTESGWTNVSLQNSWNTTGVTAFDDPSFKRNIDGRLWMRGAMNNGTKTDGTLLFTLPTGHRPAMLKQLRCSGDVAGTSPVIQVNTNGEVRVYQMGASNALVIDNTSFSLI